MTVKEFISDDDMNELKGGDEKNVVIKSIGLFPGIP